MEWWHISSMVHSYYKDYCVTLVGLRCCSYYSTYRISRQFEERQGAPHNEGAFHSTMFTNRILGRIGKAWPCHRVTKGIVPPRYIYPTTRYKQWLEDDMKWTLKDEKTYVKTSKKERRTEWPLWWAPCFTFLHFYDCHVFVFEFNKGLECSEAPMKTIFSSFNLSNKRIKFFLLLSLLIVIYSFFFFLFFFLCYVIFAQDVPLGIFVIPMVFSPNFCLDCPFRFSIRRDSLALTFI